MTLLCILKWYFRHITCVTWKSHCSVCITFKSKCKIYCFQLWHEWRANLHWNVDSDVIWNVFGSYLEDFPRHNIVSSFRELPTYTNHICVMSQRGWMSISLASSHFEWEETNFATATITKNTFQFSPSCMYKFPCFGLNWMKLNQLMSETSVE